VKDPYFLGPSLAKVVKDSTLTILFSLGSFQPSIVKEGAPLDEFFRERAHCLRERDSIWLQGVRSGGDLDLGVFVIPGTTLLGIIMGSHAPYLFIFKAGRNF
jgi:hypothetical protein